MDFSTKDIRNVTIAGHGQTGKTTLLEHLLFVGGVIPKTETTDSGKTVSDYSAEEIERKISVYASLSHIEKNGKLINFWDTPGSADFVGEVISAFRSSEAATMLIDGRNGVQIETVKLWRDLDRRNKPRMIFINHAEDERTDVATIAKDVHDKFSVEVCQVTIPMNKSGKFEGVIDVLNGKAYFTPEDGKIEVAVDIPDDYQDEYQDALGILAGSAAEGDDDLLVKFIDEGELTSEEIAYGLKIALKNNRIVPCFCANVTANSGLVPYLDFVAEIAPSPEEAIETATTKDGEIASVLVASTDVMSALVVKTSSDQFSGKLSYIKVINGTLNADTEYWNIQDARKEKIGKIYRTVGKKLVEIKSASAGDICVAAKLSAAKTSTTLSSAQDCLPFVKLRHPYPIYSMAVSSDNKKDEDKMSELLAAAAEEDRTLTYKYNPETKQNVLSGMGELHLNILLDRLRKQNKLSISTTVPRVAYRETIQRKAQAEYTHKKQSGGHGQYGRVVLAIEPLSRGDDYKFTNAVFGGAISKGYIPGVEKGVKEAMLNGVLAGYPVVDVSTTVLDGKEHPVDSSELAFKIASRNAFRDAMRQAGPILLEPIMNVTIWVENRLLGDIMSDISGRRGRILGQNDIGGGIEEIRAQVPQSELLKYAIDLRSITSGTGSFETSFDHYDPISGKIADEVIAAAKEFITVQNLEE